MTRAEDRSGKRSSQPDGGVPSTLIQPPPASRDDPSKQSQEDRLTEQARYAALYRARSRSRSLDNWGRSITLLLVLGALSGVAVGIDLAARIVFAVAFLAATAGVVSLGIGLIGIGVLATTETVLQHTVFSGGLLPYNTINYWLVLFCLLHVRHIFQFRQLQGKIHLLLTAVLAAGLLWAPTITPAGLSVVLRLVAGFGLFIYFTACPPSQHRMLLWAAISASAVATIFGVMIYGDPATAQRFNANAMAMIPLTGLFTVFLATFTKVAKRREMDVLMFLAASNLAFIFLSGSRGAIFSGLFLWLAILAWGFNLPRKMAYGVAGAFIVLGLVALSPEFQDQVMRKLEITFDDSRTLDQRSSGRWGIAMVGWSLFLENPLGIGTGAFQENMARFYDPGIRYWGRGRPPESAWVAILAENGVVGITVMLAYVASFAWTGLRRRNRQLLAVGVIASLTLALRFVTAEFEFLGVFWFAAGSSFLLHRTSAVQPAASGHSRVGGR